MRQYLALGLLLTLAACAGTDNAPQPTPLTEIKAAIPFDPIWKASHSGGSIYRFAPDIENETLFMASAERGIAAFSLADGRKLLDMPIEKQLSGGLSAQGGLVVAGTLKGEVIAYQANGTQKWRTQVSSEVIAPPAISGEVVLVRSVDGRLSGLNAQDGKLRWQFQRNQPSLILRNYAAPAIADGRAYLGLAGGKLAALDVNDGRVLWESAVAQPRGATELERVTDVTSTPVVDKGQVCAVAFQGKITCFAVSNGTQLWTREISSYSGLALDQDHVYVSDASGNVLAFDRNSGRNLWKQEKLYGRRISAPTSYAGMVAIGDLEGYIHLMSAEDGRLLARQSSDKTPILVAPRVVADKLIIQTQGGGLYAFRAKQS